MGNYPSSSYKVSRKVGSHHRSSANSGKKVEKVVRTEEFSVDNDDSSEQYSHSKRLVKTYRQDVPIPDDAPSEIKLIRQYLYRKDAGDFEGMKELTDERCYFYFADAEAEMPAREFYEAVDDTFKSFPDLHFFWKKMKIASQDQTTGVTVVKVKDYYGIGKHTGAPYAFGPYEAIPATDKTVRDENIEFLFFVKDGKLIKAEINAFGKVVGPPGFYAKIGGLLI